MKPEGDRSSELAGDEQDHRLHIAIIGSGGGAFAAALRATEAGARVTMIEVGEVGGTCVNVGCVPSKITIRAAEIAHRRLHHPFKGIPSDGGDVDRSALLRQMKARIKELQQSKYQKHLENNDAITLLHGRALLEDATTLVVEMAGGRSTRIRPDRILIASGASPLIPAIEGLSNTPFWTSTEALFTDEIPKHLVVIGASFVALELAQAHRRLGSTVTVIARNTLFSRGDAGIGQSLKAAFENEGICVLEHTTPRRINHDGRRFTIELKSEIIQSDKLLLATGRRANTDHLNLRAAGVETDKKGAIQVDERLQTTASSVYAVGDCTNMPQLVYVAAAAGTRAAMNMIGGNAELDLSLVPAVVFTDPQVATVGLDEMQARSNGIVTDVRQLDLAHVPRALANFDTHGFIKMVAEVGTGRLLGVQIVAHNAGEMIQTAALAIRNRMTVQDVANELFPYLTMVEGLKLCAQTFTKDISRLSCCAG